MSASLSPPHLLCERRRHEDLTRRRADAIAGAATVVAAKGFHDAQMSEIAAAAEVSPNSLYALFERKERLDHEVISAGHAKIRAQFALVLGSKGDS